MAHDRRKEIREGLRRFRCARCMAAERCDWRACDTALGGFITFLSENDVVIKTVEGHCVCGWGTAIVPLIETEDGQG